MGTLEQTIFFGFVLVGPILSVLLTVLVLVARRQMRLLTRPLRPLPDPPPNVTVLIPCKDEGERISACLHSVLNQTYPDLQVIAIDDRSTDQTGQVMDSIAATDARLGVVHIPHGDLPAGWTGKCHALAQGVQSARGTWLMFVDSDVILQPDAVAAAIQRADRQDYDLLSLLPRIESHSFWEELIIPVAGAGLNFMFLVPLSNKNYCHHAFANGQFLLIRHNVYDKIGGHAAVMGMFGEDVAMARLVKSHGYKVRIAWGADFMAVRMYSTLTEIVRGWARQFFAPGRGSPWRIIFGFLLTLVLGFSWMAGGFWGLWSWWNSGWSWQSSGSWLTVAAANWVLLTWLLATVYRSSGNRARFAWAHPLALSMLLIIFIRAVRMCLDRQVQWRGTSYHARPAADGATIRS